MARGSPTNHKMKIALWAVNRPVQSNFSVSPHTLHNDVAFRTIAPSPSHNAQAVCIVSHKTRGDYLCINRVVFPSQEQMNEREWM